MASCEEEAEESWECLRCGGEVTAANREVTTLREEDADGDSQEEEGQEEVDSEAESEQYA